MGDKEQVPNLPMRKQDPPHVSFESGRSLGRYETSKNIVNKLRKRANHLLKNCESPDSPMILVSAELKINADEIEESQK